MTSLLEEPDRVQSTPAQRTYGPVVAACAALLCLGGLVWAGWTVYDTTRPTERPKAASDLAKLEGVPKSKANLPEGAADASGPQPKDGERKIVAAGPGGKNGLVAMAREIPLPPKDAVYTPVANADEATEVVTTLSSAIGIQSTKIDGLTPTPLQTSDQVGASVKAFLAPLVQGEIKDPSAFLVANGATVPASGPNATILNNIAALLKFCDLDTTHTRVHRAPKIQNPLGNMMPNLPPGSISMMINRQETDGESVSSLMMPLSGLLPEANTGISENAARIEILIPAKLKDPQFATKPFQLGLIMAQNSGKGKWIPEMLQFHTTDVETVKALSKTIRPRNASSESGAPAPKAPSDGGR